MKSNWRLFAFVLSIVVLTALAGPTNAGYFEKTFLLEANASYEVTVYVKTDLEDKPALASVYMHTDHGEYLRSTRLSRGVPNRENGWHEISVVVSAVDDAQRATVKISTEDNVPMEWDDFHIRRIEMSEAIETDLEPDKVYTGLIIDAKGLDLRRGMSPRIFSESGQLIYAGVVAQADYIQEKGIASYGYELSPRLVERLQSKGQDTEPQPLVVQAEEVTGETKNSVVISDDDAEKILESLDHHDYLARYSVVFLID